MTTGRLNYLDQFRGYTVAGMIAVNFLGAYQAVHPLLKHHKTYCSYADTIMPQFFLAVGFALRLTIVRRMQSEGWKAAQLRVLRRVLGLLLIAALVHGFDRINTTWEGLWEHGPLHWITKACERQFFQTLTHIAVTMLWVLPVIALAWPVRVLWILLSPALHLVWSHDFYLQFALTRPVIDGGPLGFLTLTIPVLVGSLACDVLTGRSRRAALARLMFWSVALMALGYGLSCLTWGTPSPEQGWCRPAQLPFVPPADPMHPDASYQARNQIPPQEVVTLWTMSQRTGSASYQTFAAGFSLALLVMSVLIFGEGRQIGLFRTLGSNALIVYVVHGMAIEAVNRVMPKDGPLLIALAACAVVVGVTWTVCRSLEKRGWYLRV